MNQKVLWQDKLKDFRAYPSDRVWEKIEKGLDDADRENHDRHRTVWGIAAAIAIAVIAYLIGVKSGDAPEYFPTTLEIRDQASEVMIPLEYRVPEGYLDHNRKDGYLIPNAHTLWDNPLRANPHRTDQGL